MEHALFCLLRSESNKNHQTLQKAEDELNLCFVVPECSDFEEYTLNWHHCNGHMKKL